jgi:alginate O-acetyltransferase complex protein AlgI
MLFSSYTFLFQFLPATVLAFAAARRHSPRAGIMVLAARRCFSMARGNRSICCC